MTITGVMLRAESSGSTARGVTLLLDVSQQVPLGVMLRLETSQVRALLLDSSLTSMEGVTQRLDSSQLTPESSQDVTILLMLSSPSQTVTRSSPFTGEDVRSQLGGGSSREGLHSSRDMNFPLESKKTGLSSSSWALPLCLGISTGADVGPAKIIRDGRTPELV